MVLLKPNDNNEYVVKLQAALNQKIGTNLPLTGLYGPMTTQAVIDFQKQAGLEVDGVCGPDTWEALTGEKSPEPKDRNITFYILAGHDLASDPGAINSGLGITEAKLAYELRDMIVEKMRAKGAAVVTDNDMHNLAQTINDVWNKVKPWDVLIDLHFNAATPAAVGVEAFVSEPCTKEENKIASDLVAKVASILESPVRPNWTNALLPGVKYETATRHKRLGILRPACQNILMETCFISNNEEIQKYIDRKEAVATSIADYLVSL